MELLRTDSKEQLFESYTDLKYVDGGWMRAADRIDNIVDNHINADPIKNRDYLVELRCRYDADINAGRPYSFTTEFIYHEDERDGYCWLNDWYEGQQDIDVMRIIAVDEIDEFESIEYTTSKLSEGYIPADITSENYANIFDATIKSWMNKHEMYTDVIVRLAYKVKSDPEIRIRNEFLEFNGNEGIFEWTHKWEPEDLEFFYATGVIDPDDIEKYTTVYTEHDAPSYRETIRNVSGSVDGKTFEQWAKGIYRKLDETLKKFATENDCMGEELVVLWVHTEDSQWVLRKDVFHLLHSTLWDSPELMYQVPGGAFAYYENIMIWAIRPLSQIKEFDHWFVSTHNYAVKQKTSVPISQTNLTPEQLKDLKAMALAPVIDAINEEMKSGDKNDSSV
jgi:hypothetical protein